MQKGGRQRNVEYTLCTYAGKDKSNPLIQAYLKGGNKLLPQ